jgi:hypothetical protein
MRHLFSGGGMVLSLLALAPAARAEDREAINRAVQRGVAALKQMQQADGTWPCLEIGATALAGLTLLECDVPKTDPAVKQAAEAVRRDSTHLTRTYSLALSILFLDRLGEEADVPIIEAHAVRLLAGQNARGGWNYDCPDVPEADARRLSSLLKQRAELTTRPRPGDAARKPDKSDEAQRLITSRKLADDIRQQIEVIHRAGGRKADSGRDDNSNTQFAVLALWVARRHGLPSEDALRLVAARYRTSQNADGGWDYQAHASRNGRSTPTMTCAGLLGLAAGFGAAAEVALRTEKPKDADKPNEDDKAKPPDPKRDRAVRVGLAALGTSIGHPAGKGRPAPVLTNGGRMYYFLWSLERVAVAFGLTTIGGKDWYDWGSEIVVASQQADGTWKGDFAAVGADTCFALLFLRRANLARDLTMALKGKVEDPGEATLSAGGVGGEALKQRVGLKSALESPEMFEGTKSEGDRTRPVKPVANDGDPEAARLSRQLVQAAADRRDGLLTQMRDGRGAVYTDALAGAIPHLDGDARKKAREALADRLSRMTSATLGVKLDDDNPEVRRAAALAVAMREDKAHVERLIDLLDDKEKTVSRAAYAALKELSGQDFGPATDAGREEHKKAVAAWRAWWKEKGKR